MGTVGTVGTQVRAWFLFSLPCWGWADVTGAFYLLIPIRMTLLLLFLLLLLLGLSYQADRVSGVPGTSRWVLLRQGFVL